MGQKVNPVGFRLGVNRGWDSVWYAKKKDFGNYLIEDFKIRAYIKKNVVNSGVSKVMIERTSNKCFVTIYTSRPGFVIGKKGSDIDKIKNNEDLLNIKEFWKYFWPSLSGERLKIVNHLWENLNVRAESKISISRLKNRYCGKFHPEVIDKNKTALECEEEFFFTLDFHGQLWNNRENFVDEKQFKDFMRCWSCSEQNDKKFLTILVDCFRLSAFFGIYSKMVNETEDRLENQNSHSSNVDKIQRDHKTIPKIKNNNWGNNRNNNLAIHQNNQGSDLYQNSKHSNNKYSSNMVNNQRNENQRNNYNSNNYYDNVNNNNNDSRAENNIISGKKLNRSRSPVPSNKSEIRQNFYDEMKNNFTRNKRAIKPNRRTDTERISQISRNRSRRIDENKSARLESIFWSYKLIILILMLFVSINNKLS